MTDPFAPQVLSIKVNKILNAVTAGLNVGVLEQATAYISLLTLHGTTVLRNNNLPALSKCHLHNDMKQSTFLNIQYWYCVKCTCVWISSFGSASSNAIGISYTATHTQELFCNILFHGKRTVSNHDHFVLQFRANFICSLHLLGYDKFK